MRKDSKLLNRSLALAIAAAMTVTSVPSSVLAADLFGDGSADVAPVAVQEMADTDVFDSGVEETVEEAVEEVFTAPAVVEEAMVDTFDTPVQDPGQVVNLRAHKDTGALCWDAITAADYYRVYVTDGQYSYGSVWGSEVYYRVNNYYPENYVVAGDLQGKDAYQKNADGTWAPVEKKTVAGGTYTVTVCAVNGGAYVGTEWLEEKVGTASAAFQYTIPAVTLDKVVNLREEDGKLYFDYSRDNASFEVEITDQFGRGYYYNSPTVDPQTNTDKYDNAYADVYSGKSLRGVSAWAYQKSGNYWESVMEAGKSVKPFQTGVAYTVKVRAYSGENRGAWSDPITVTLSEVAAPAIPNARVKGEGMNWTLEWSNVEGAEGYEYVVKDAAGTEYVSYKDANGANVYANLNSTYAVLSDGDAWYKDYDVSNLRYRVSVQDANGNYVYPFEKGKPYTIQVRAYNTTNAGAKQYSQFSQPTSPVTYATATTIAKPEGLVVRGNQIFWNSVEDAEKYEVRVVDNLGREYYEATPVTAADGKTTYDYWDEWGTGAELSGGSLNTYQYQKPENEWKAIKNPNDGKSIVAFKDYFKNTDMYAVKADTLPLSYTLYVRAVKGDLVSDWSNAATYTVTDKAIIGIKETPAKVSGVRVKTESDKAKDAADQLYGVTLVWNYLEKAQNYEIVVKDAAGNEYSLGYDTGKAEKGEFEREYVSVEALFNNAPSLPLSSLAGKKAYTMAPGSAITTLKGADGKDLLALTSGQTYTIQVRAVNSYREFDPNTNMYGEAQMLYGEWSDPVTYVAPAAETIADLSFVKEEKGYAYFTYSAKVSANVWYQIAEDAAFTVIEKGWTYGSDKVNKLSIGTGDLVPGKTYYVRAVCSPEKPKAKDLAGLTIPAASFTVAPKAAKNITGLTVYKVENRGDNDTAYFRFDAVLEDGDNYEVQYSVDGANWKTVWPGSDYNGGFTLNLGQFDEGTIQVRVVAYTEVYNGATGNEDKVYGQASAPVSVVVSKATTAISALKLAEKTPAGYVFSFAGTPRASESVEVWYSTDASFTNNKKLTAVTYYNVDKKNLRFTIDYSNFEPGKSYYVKARVSNPNAKPDAEKYSAFTNAVKVSAVIPRIKVWGAAVTATSVTLRMEALNEDYYLTGYEVQKKVDSKFAALTKTTDNTFKDTKLKKDTTYQYRVRPYYYDSETKKTKNGTWVYYETTTWGGSLKATARAASKNSIKLSWKKISGAQGYEIYRLATSSYSTEDADGRGNDYEKYQLIKTIKKGTTVKYTDKKLNKNLAYQYKVVAYKVVDGKKYTITEYTDSVNLAFDSAFAFTDEIVYANGKVKVTWSPVYGATGYLVEKYNSETEVWSVYKKLKAKTSSITFPKNTGDKTITYRVRAYKGTEYSNADHAYVSPHLAAVTGVKAKANAANGSITVSWKAVAGADYYEVYRTTSSYALYNKNAKTYAYDGGDKLARYVADASKVSGYRKAKTSEKNVTSFVDAPLTYTVDGVTNTLYAGPTPGVKYYYYVVAYKKAPEYGYKSEYKESSDGDIESFRGKAASATVSAVKKPAKTKISKITAAKKKATLKWKKVSKADGYVIYRSTNKKKGYEEVGTITKGSTVKYTDKKLTSGKTYYYKVKAFTLNEAGLKVLSNFSAVKSVKAK